jgi:hypothetical protein
MYSVPIALATLKTYFRGNNGLAILGALVDDGALECNRWHQPNFVLGALE